MSQYGGRRVLLLGQILAFLNLSTSRPTTSTTSTSTTSSSTTTSTSSIESPPPSPSPVQPPSPSMSPAPTTTASISLPGQPTQPVPVYGMAYALDSDGHRLLLQGGVGIGSTGTSQYFGLDLTQSWSVESPAWNNLAGIEPQQAINAVAPGPRAPAATPSTLSGRSGVYTKYKQFLVLGDESDSEGLYFFNSTVAQWINIPFAGNSPFSPHAGPSLPGPLIAEDANLGTIYFFLDGYTLNATGRQSQGQQAQQLNPLQSSNLTLPSGQAVSWSTVLNGFLSTAQSTNSKAMDVQLFTPTPNTPSSEGWLIQNTTVIGGSTGGTITARSDHCFIPNNSGSKYYMFGGIEAESGIVLADLYELDVINRTWTMKPSPSQGQGQGRSQMACVVNGNTFIAWGGLGTGQSPVDIKPMLFDIATNNWTTNFTAETPSYPPVLPYPTPAPDIPKSNHTGAIIGGAVSAVVVIVAMVAFFVTRQKRQRRTLTKNGTTTFSDYSHAKMDNDPYDKGGLAALGESPAGHNTNRYTVIQSPFSDDSPEQVQMRALQPEPTVVLPYQDPQPVQQQQPMTNYSPYFQPPVVPVVSAVVPQAPPSPRLQQKSLPPPPIPLPQTRPEVRPIDAYHDDDRSRQRDFSGSFRDEEDGDDGQASVASRSVVAPSAVELIPIEDDGAPESQGFLSRATSAAGFARASARTKVNQKKLQPPPHKEEEEEGSRRESSESLEYLEVA